MTDFLNKKIFVHSILCTDFRHKILMTNINSIFNTIGIYIKVFIKLKCQYCIMMKFNRQIDFVNVAWGQVKKVLWPTISHFNSTENFCTKVYF